MKKVLLLLILFVLFPIKCFAVGTVEINTASLQQLETLTGIGPVRAQAIISARPFSSVDDLLKVKGIGPKTLQGIESQGLAYVAGQTQQPAQQAAPIGTETPAIPQTSGTEATTASNELPTPAPPAVYPAGIFINEILPNPKGPDETDEWIELYDSDNFDVDLSGWQLQDVQGIPTTFTIPSGTIIPANGFLVFKRPETKIMLNNDGDGLNLLTPDKKIADSVNFTAAPLDQSYNKTDYGWQWSLTLTPGNKNIITAVKAASTVKSLSNTKNSVKNDVKDAAPADISQNSDPNQENSVTNPWFLFFIVLAATIILAVIVLVLKLKFFKNHVRT